MVDVNAAFANVLTDGPSQTVRAVRTTALVCPQTE